ncbi:hypothetical protein [Actinocorallia populi]|uniref:hypothetical protein n=1 Tax=Actinocorallia populi TaxID=2079200 RepID=UPI000D0949FA|nr:hypothetical protein [Actinocorallia populi]
MAGRKSKTHPLSAVLTAAALGAATLTASAAQATETGLLQCQGTETIAYSPGVTLTPRDITFTIDGRFTSCLDTANQVTSGSYDEEFTVTVGCNGLLDSFEGERVLTWNTGDTSTAEINGQSTAVLGQVITTITGTITQGRFQGRSVLQTVTLPQLGFLQCATTGLTGTTGLTTLTLT